VTHFCSRRRSGWLPVFALGQVEKHNRGRRALVRLPRYSDEWKSNLAIALAVPIHAGIFTGLQNVCRIGQLSNCG
jgi:hypothetical protein